MMHKLFSARTWTLVAVVLAMCGSLAQAKGYANLYQYEGTLVEVRERNVTVINDKDKVVVHAVAQGDVHLNPAGFHPGDKVYVQLRNPHDGLWELVGIKKL